MADPQQIARDAADKLISFFGQKPRWVFELGSGFGTVAQDFVVEKSLRYRDLPGFISPSIAGHDGRIRMICGNNGCGYIFYGRSHSYEGSDPGDISALALTAGFLDAEGIILCSACGALESHITPGQLFIAHDVLRFPPRSNIGHKPVDPFKAATLRPKLLLDSLLTDHVYSAAVRNGLPLHRGVMAIVQGPCYETASEAEILRKFGAGAVTMSCAPTIESAARLSIPVALTGCITNQAANRSTKPTLTHDDVLQKASEFSGMLTQLITALVGA